MIWVGRLIALACILQTVELFWIAPWDWKIVSEEWPKWVRPLLRFNKTWLVVRLLAASLSLFFPNPVFVGILLLTTWAIAVRWRGTFNGGSDAMTFLILAAWWASLMFPSMQTVCVLYISIQLILSYLVAGIAKAASPQWRNGEALQYFLNQSGFYVSPVWALFLGWAVIVFECLSPLAFFAPSVFVAFAVAFHLANVFLFGLNRFFFAWLAAYPALLMAALH